MKYLLLFITTLFTLNCTDSSPIANGTKIPNMVKGQAFNSDGTPATGKSILTKVSVLSYNDHSTVIDSTTLDSNGYYTFSNVDDNHYSIQLISDNKTAIVSNIDLTNNDTITVNDATVEAPITLTGRALNGENSYVFIPGTSISAKVEANGVYTLSNVPTGSVDLSFSSEMIAYFPINIMATEDTIAILDTDLEVVSEMASQTYPSSKDVHIALPVVYEETPAWYNNKNFSNVEYIDSNGDIEDNRGLYDLEYAKNQLITLLLVTDYVAHNDDKKLIELLKDRGYNLKITTDTEATEDDSTAVDAIIIPYTADIIDLQNAFVNMLLYTDKPVLVMETSIAKEMDMNSWFLQADSSVERSATISIIDSSHYITPGLFGDTEVMKSSQGSFDAAEVGTFAQTVATTIDHPDKSLIYTYDTGDSLLSQISNGKRVGFHFKANTFTKINEVGSDLFLRSIEWMLMP